MKEEFRRVELWLQLNKITLKYKKSNCVLFTNNSIRNSNDFCKTATNGIIYENTTLKYLGVIIDRKLTWKIMFNISLKSYELQRVDLDTMLH